ncbi:MAG: prepilin-type N-terminal cleavage/methylation domain-containing protein [bacterium]
MLNTARTDDGFTLVEVLIALAVMGIIMMPVANLVSQSLKTIRSSKSRKTAAKLAQECLGLIRSTVQYGSLPTGGESISCDGSSTGSEPYSFDAPYGKYDYVTSVKKVENNGGKLPLKMVRIRVLFPATFHEGKRCISTTDCGSSDWDYNTLIAER